LDGLVGGTSSDLDSVPTATATVGELYSLVDESGDDPVYRVYRLESGTDATNAPDVIRPTDYATTTNERVFRLVLPEPPAAPELPERWSIWNGTNVSIADTTTETNIINQTIPANTMTADGAAISLTAQGLYFNNYGSGQRFALRFKLDGVTVYQDDTPNFIHTAADSRIVAFFGRIIRISATKAKMMIEMSVGTAGSPDVGLGEPKTAWPSPPCPLVSIDATVDWTASTAFVVSVEFYTASAALTYTHDWTQMQA
jgi:hypothetical protein